MPTVTFALMMLTVDHGWAFMQISGNPFYTLRQCEDVKDAIMGSKIRRFGGYYFHELWCDRVEVRR